MVGQRYQVKGFWGDARLPRADWQQLSSTAPARKAGRLDHRIRTHLALLVTDKVAVQALDDATGPLTMRQLEATHHLHHRSILHCFRPPTLLVEILHAQKNLEREVHLRFVKRCLCLFEHGPCHDQAIRTGRVGIAAGDDGTDERRLHGVPWVCTPRPTLAHNERLPVGQSSPPWGERSRCDKMCGEHIPRAVQHTIRPLQRHARTAAEAQPNEQQRHGAAVVGVVTWPCEIARSPAIPGPGVAPS